MVVQGTAFIGVEAQPYITDMKLYFFLRSLDISGYLYEYYLFTLSQYFFLFIKKVGEL